MSISVSKIVNLPQAALKFLVQDEIDDEQRREYKTIGGVFSDTDYAWLASGPRLEVVHTKTGNKIGAWTFGWVLKDSNTEVVCVDEIQRPHGRLPLLVVGVDCDFSGGMLCIFDFVTSKVIRAVHVKDKITNVHVIDAGFDVFTLPGPLRNFDGIIAVGTAGGDVFLIDICRQICDEALTTGGLTEIRDELNPCLLSNITSKDISKIEFHKEFAVRNSQHLAIHLNIVFDKSTKHFILKGPKGDDRIHVNKDEVAVSALYYCPQLGSLLVGYNFGALQLYNLMNLDLVYTSPVCDEHIPISHFAVQEPADDPRAFCYVWAVYSAKEQYPTCLPLAVMYAFCYHTKEYHEGYGFIYQDFNTASVHYQMELGVPEGHKRLTKPRGGCCLRLNSINQGPLNREDPHQDSNEDNLTLCVLVWNVWFNSKETDTFIAVFDLNQWYKEQMPSVPNIQYCSTYMIQMYLSDLINSATNKSVPVLDVYTDKSSLQQFTGAQRLEEHFCPNSISFGMCCLRESDLILLNNHGVQKALLAQIESSGPLCLVEPAEIYQEVIGLGLIPLFIDLAPNTPITTNQQREIILGAALENQLMGWLCKCASEWANGSFLATGCSLDLLISWAFQRAVALKTNCDKFCVPLFDYSETRLDNNSNILLNSCTRQLKNLSSLYAFIIRKLSTFISNQELVQEQYKSLQMVSVYFEVLQWLLNVGLLPECPMTAYPRSDDMERINAPYPAEMLIDFYNHRRALLKIQNEEQFSSSESVLFIDTLIERKCGAEMLQKQWRNDGGNGLYPPPSLQALLRTYLIDNVELSYKHSVIIYVFLDLAMTLDQDRYKPVITHLIKFPAVFKMSPSLIKITQAFWQLDHGDYNTAMGLLLDPLILTDDLSHWHHKIALRSLLLQKQHNFALLYVQVRKPALKDDEDILTAISLYVANNMLDEAFYFEKHFTSQPNGDKFLAHFFNECKKNNNIRSIIYRSLNDANENFFLKYLVDSKQSTAEDLHVYYHVLRSHYIEAFEIHQRTVTNHIENQGLVGQENAIPRDKLVYSLKKLLPDVNRVLLSLCHKEGNNVWQQVARPTPMSVFVHNLNENVQYKSTLIGAALAKAKQTFNETLSDEFKMETENTPFLRTPTISVGSRRSSAVVINPKFVDVDHGPDDISSPSSAKRLKLSPRLSNTTLSGSFPSRLDTPMVKRKTPKTRSGFEEKLNNTTPHSILKVRSLINGTSSKQGESQYEDNFNAFEKLEYTPVISVNKKSGLGLSPRKSLAKASPVVRFEGLKSSSSSSLTNSHNLSGFTDKLSESINDISTNNNVQTLTSSKNTSTEEETFCTPETSFENEQGEVDVGTSKISEEITKIEEKTEEMEEKSEQIQDRSEEIQEKSEENLSRSPVFSPKARRSYKRSLGSVTPVRSSPRLSKNATITKETPIPSPQKTLINKLSEESTATSVKEISVDDSKEKSLSPVKRTSKLDEESISSPNVTPLLPKLRPRKSLCRKVLETNALSRALSADSPRSSRSKKLDVAPETEEIKTTEEFTEKVTLESTATYADGEEIHELSFVKKHNLTTVSLLESDLDTSEDYSFNYSNADKPILSESLMRCVNNDKSMSLDQSEASEVEETVPEKNVADGATLEVNSVTDSETPKNNNVIDSETLEVSTDKNLADDKNLKEDKLEPVKDIADGTAVDLDVTSHRDNSMDYSVLDSSTEFFSKISYKETGPKFSESMMRCINNFDSSSENIDTSSNNVGDGAEVLEVSDDTENNKNTDKEKSDDSIDPKPDEDESKRESSFDDVPSKSNKEEEKEDSYGGPSNNRPLDPEMNVFEISDDLSLNDGLMIQKEVTLEENDLCYDQQNTLESVLEENINAVTSTCLNVFEKNVFAASSSNSDDEDEQEQDCGQKMQTTENKTENEVIEIGSSSDEYEEQNKSESSEFDSENSQFDSDGEKFEVSYERNIYDTEGDYSSESSYEHRSEVSDNSDEAKYNQTEVNPGLFYSNIAIIDENDEEEDEDVEQSTIQNTDEKPLEVISSSEEHSHKSNESLSEQLKGINDVSNEQIEDGSLHIDVAVINEEKAERSNEDAEEQSPVIGPSPRIYSEEKSFRKTDNEMEDSRIETSEQKLDETDPQFGLFYGDIILGDEQEKCENVENTEEPPRSEDNETRIVNEEQPRKKMEDQDVSQDTEKKLKETLTEEKLDEEDVERSENISAESTEQDINSPVEDKREIDDQLDGQVTEKDSESEMQNSFLVEEDDCNKNRNPLDSPGSCGSIVTTEQTQVDDTESFVSKEQKEPKLHSVPTTSKTIEVDKEPVKVRHSTRKNDKLKVDTSKKRESINDLEVTSQPVRVLRSRTVSTEEVITPTSTLRKRSASVDETKTVSSKQPLKKQKEIEVEDIEVEDKKDRRRRASSVSYLPKISEVDDEVQKHKKSSSVIEDYSLTRRMTRRQLSLLKKTMDCGEGEKKINLDYLDPTVLLDRLPFDGKPDPDEKKIYETSPSTTNSASSTPTKPSRRLRSASQVSESSRRSKSKTPVRTLKGRSRKASTDETSDVSTTSNKSMSKTRAKKVMEESTVPVEPRLTRRSAKSAASVNSDESNTSETSRSRKRRQKLTSDSTLPLIKEESSNDDKSTVPKKRTRKNSSQK